ADSADAFLRRAFFYLGLGRAATVLATVLIPLAAGGRGNAPTRICQSLLPDRAVDQPQADRDRLWAFGASGDSARTFDGARPLAGQHTRVLHYRDADPPQHLLAAGGASLVRTFRHR